MKSKTFKILGASLALFLCGTTNLVYAQDANSTQRYTENRLGGSTRFETAIKIADQYATLSNMDTFENVVLATSNDFPDSLSGTVLAEKLNAPILLVDKTAIASSATLNYIESKVSKSGKIYMLGGTGVVTNDIVNSLINRGFNPSNFIRLGGSDRFATNAMIKNQLNVSTGTPVVLVRADSFPDALSISSIAAIKGYPIILTNSGSLSPSAKAMINDIKPSQIYLVGGTGVLTPRIVSDINAMSGITKNLTRISGQDRYETSRAIMQYFNLNTNNCVIATGVTFPDGIAGGVLAAKLHASILLTSDESLDKQHLALDSTNISSLNILGGEGAVSKNIADSFNKDIIGFDMASAYSAQVYQQFKNAGYSFVLRYYCDYDPIATWKNNLTLQEAKDISQAGLSIVPVYQDGGYGANYFTSDNGSRDCQKAIDYAKAAGQPAGTAIYFPVDFEALSTSDFNAIDAYFNGIKQTMIANSNYYKIGVYGSYSVIDHVRSQLGTDTYTWQTSSWNKGNINNGATIYQYQQNSKVLNINIDMDSTHNSMDSIGGFTVK
jgi:putative cell wall-binding protein